MADCKNCELKHKLEEFLIEWDKFMEEFES